MGMGGGLDFLENRRQFGMETRIGKTKEAQATRGQNRIPLLVIIRSRLMHFAVEFHHQPCRMAVKIGNKASNDLLAAKVESAEAAGAKMLP